MVRIKKTHWATPLIIMTIGSIIIAAATIKIKGRNNSFLSINSRLFLTNLLADFRALIGLIFGRVTIYSANIEPSIQ